MITEHLTRLHVPMLDPRDVIPHLARGELHWREGYSAHALATTWFQQAGLPPAVRTALDCHDEFRGADLVDAILERKTDLRDGVRGQSQTDLIAILGLGGELAVAAVEGKVEESFGLLVSDWLTMDLHRQRRLNGLTAVLGLTGEDISGLRYQLLHRSVAALFEAERYRARKAVLLVHSFSSRRTGWNDFAAFVRAVGFNEKVEPGRIFGPRRIGTTELFAGWIADVLPGKGFR